MKYWLSRRYYQQINGTFILKRWEHKLKSIERIKLTNGRWVWSIEGYNTETKEFHQECFRDFPKLENK